MIGGERRVTRLSTYRGRHYWWGTVAWLVYFAFPLVPGWLTGQVFDELQANGRSSGFWLMLGALLVSEAAVAAMLVIGHMHYMQGLNASIALARANAVHAQLASGGADAGPRRTATGDALARLRDDPLDVLMLLDNWVDLGGSVLYGAGAAYLLARIDPWAAAMGIAPLFLIGFANSRVGNAVRRVRSRARAATSDVTRLLSSSFEASLTLKLAGAQGDVVRRLDRLNARRSRAMVADQVWYDAIYAVNGTLTDVCVGLALVVAARGRLTAGEVTVFAAYLFNLVWLPQRLGGVVIGRRRYEVSAARLDELVPPPVDGVDRLAVHRPLPILVGRRPDAAAEPPPALPVRVPLERLDVTGLEIWARGVGPVDLTVERGTLTVVAGPVGAGKTSLLRGVLGLLPADAGEVRWNGELIVDRARFFVPPQCGYVPQVPRLFAESLADNLRLGHRLDDDALLDAVRLARFEQDVAAFGPGLGTLIGTRGVRLSGGQAQRAAAARALVHRPELLVVDDLASALDPDTEIELWDRLLASGITVLAASNRPAALVRADQVLHLQPAAARAAEPG